MSVARAIDMTLPWGCGKTTFRSAAEANMAKGRLLKRKARTNRGRLEAYYCPACGGFHFGHTRKR